MEVHAWCPCGYSCTPLQRYFRKPEVFRQNYLVIVSSRLGVVRMNELDYEMNYKVDQLIVVLNRYMYIQLSYNYEHIVS